MLPAMRTIAMKMFVVGALTLAACGGGAAETKGPNTAADGPSEGGGKKAPSLSVETVNGKGKIELAKGKVYIVDFWATWCEPCKKSFPKYQELYTKYQSSGLEIIAVSVDDENKGIEAFIKQHGAKFPVAWDEGHKIADQWKPESMPTAFVIDKEGVIRHVHAGYHDGEEAELDKEIKELL